MTGFERSVGSVEMKGGDHWTNEMNMRRKGLKVTFILLRFAKLFLENLIRPQTRVQEEALITDKEMA